MGGVVLDSRYAARKGVGVGDTIKLVFDPDDVLPVRREFTVTAVVDGISDEGIETVIINQDEYIAIYLDRPTELLVCCDDPEAVKDTLETYGKNSYSEVKTTVELDNDNKVRGAAVNAIINTVIGIAIGMTAIGVVSNLIIGFEGRKKECAVLLSTSMNKSTLSGILFKEVFITSLTASGIGVALGTFLLTVVAKAFDNSELFSLDMDIDYKRSLIFFAVLTIVFTGTVLFPIKSLKKMKISEQIKYE